MHGRVPTPAGWSCKSRPSGNQHRAPISCPKQFFFFKQKTAYEISVCDWSSDVCSSDRRFFFFKQKTAYEISECDWSSDVCSSDPPVTFRNLVCRLLLVTGRSEEPKTELQSP